MNNERYYWLCSYPLKNGSIVIPGNWGRIVGLYNESFGNQMIKLREIVFERIRNTSYGEKPSRLNCNYLCKSVEDIRQFKIETNRFIDLIYEVEIIDKNKKTCSCSWRMANFNETDNEASFEEKAHGYWSYNGQENLEILTESEIKIIDRVNA